MNCAWKRILAGLLIFAMVFSILPFMGENASTASASSSSSVTGATGMVTNDEVNFRQGPSLKSPYLFKLNRGTVVELLSIPSDTDLDPWYQVQYNGSTGYIQGPFIRVMSYGSIAPAGGSSSSAQAAGYVTLILSSCHLRTSPGGLIFEDWEERGATLPVAGDPVSQGGYTWYPVTYKGRTLYVRGDCVSATSGSGSSSVPAESSSSVLAGYVKTTKSGVNLRLQPAGTVITQVGKDQTFPYYGTPKTEGGYTWYYVEVDSVKGYLRSDCVKVVSSSSPTEAPSGNVTEAPSASYGYVKTTVKKVNLRATPGGSTQEQIEEAGTVLPCTGTPVVSGKYTWYPVRSATGRTGFLRSDCVTVCDANGNAGSSSTPTPTPGPGSTTPSTTPTTAPSSTSTSGSVKTIKTNVALRASASPDGAVRDRVVIGTVLPFTNVTTGGGYTWYQVTYNKKSYYIRGDCVTVVSESGGSSPAPTTTSSTGSVLGYIKTTKSGVNVRTEPAGRNVLGRVDKGNVYPYYEKKSASGYSWYKVNTVYGTGYLRSDCVTEVDSSGGSLPVPTAVPGSTDVSTHQAEASYATLKVGSTGTGVRNLVQELINQGYYKGSLTSEYTTAVANAVKAFQSANGLTADGIAGEATQHKLFGTTPVGTQDYSNLSMVLYAAEKIDWFTGGIQELIPKGSNFKVYDVKTGIVWWAHRWSGGNHADIETLTASDTARLCRIYGVSKASQITESTHWQRRPSLITVGTRTFACALYGVPHNEDGDTIADNNLTGQICLHFTNSRTHGTNVVVSYNEEAIDYAWQYAPNGHK